MISAIQSVVGRLSQSPSRSGPKAKYAAPTITTMKNQIDPRLVLKLGGATPIPLFAIAAVLGQCCCWPGAARC